MKITSFLLLVNIFMVSAADSYSQKAKVTIQAKNNSITEVLDQLSKASELTIMYSTDELNEEALVNGLFEDVSVEEVLNCILKDQLVGYAIVEDKVIISKRRYEESRLVQQDKQEISGQVTDTSGQPIPGVNISVKGTVIGTITDIDGRYTLEVPANAEVIVFTFIGMKPQEVDYKNQTTINMVMSEDTQGLEEVTVVGYGSQRKVSVTGSIETIEPATLRVPSSNISTSFAGKLAGVIAFQRSGEPGADGANFYIRGISTFSGATNPLIIVDGVEVSQADLNALPPEVIENFSILKDATATALYGTRGANGVMIVNTKSGKDMERAKVNVRIENSVSMPTSIPDFVDGPRFMEMYNEAIAGRNTGDIPYSRDKIAGTRAGLDPYLYPNVDWHNELFKNMAMNQTANVSVLGGGKRMDYFMNVSANLDNGILKDFDLMSYDSNVKVRRYAFQNNINAQLTPSTRVSLRMNARLRQYNGPAIGAKNVFGNVMQANPVDFPMLWPDEYIPREENQPELDHIPFGGKSGGLINNGYVNPFAEMVKGYSEGFQSTLITTLDGEQKLDFVTEGLKFKAMASFKNWSNTTVKRVGGINQYEASNIVPNDQGGYDYDFNMVGTVQNPTLGTETESKGDRSLYFQTQLEYNRSFGLHRTSGMLLYSQDEYLVNNPDGLIPSLPKRRQGLAGRLTYSYNDIYLTEVNFGYNGSENFAKGHRFGFFPSVSLGYVMSNEDYWTNLSHIVSFLKIRGSWGKVGNDKIIADNEVKRFVYMSDIDLTGAGYTTGRDMNYYREGPVYNRYANNDITWEIGEKINVGADIGFFNGKLNLVADFYREVRDGIFLKRAVIPTSFGTDGTNIFGNLGKVKNQGVDLALDYNHEFSPDFSMQLKGTFTFARNEVLAKDEPAFSKYPNLSAVGHPVHTLWGYVAERLFIDEAEIDNSALQQIGGTVLPGDIKYTDITAAIDELNLINSDDRMAMGHPTVPEIVYGFGPSFKYKKLDFSLFFQGVANTSFFINGFHPFGTSQIRNVLSFIEEDYWTEDNQNIYAAYPRLSKMDHPNNTQNSSFWLRNGAFLKLKNAEIGYTHKFLRVYMSGLNLLTFSEFDLWDPEMGGGNGLKYPTQRVFNIGVQLSL
ncbi:MULTISPECIES: SusC/RagA family TonB-linked outer membrane protein [unclassified Carboxylicivirga]|uniref:SusC/RagA family TonB-linked outer membrane protein n=1 Tax=Carboxylicivirga TaxID=1628153 RepID=UPI003D33A6BE